MDRRAFLKSAPSWFLDGAKRMLARDSGSRRRLAVMDIARCLAWGEGSCQACYLRCPLRDEAILLEGGRPVIVASSCDGCGICEQACRTVNDLGAIRMAEISAPFSS